MDLTSRLIGKAIEAFLLAVEIYNKPTLKYRAEGFSIFICNAWELILKAQLIKTRGEASIYHKDNPTRTLSLERCIKEIFTNDKDPLRRNLEKIIELRNTSTHFITEEYEMVYIPLFQSCVVNFTDKLSEFHEKDISDFIPMNFLTLPMTVGAVEESEIRTKYSEPIAEHLVKRASEIAANISESNSKFAIRLVHDYYITKNRDKATEVVHIAADGETPAKILKDWKDPSQTHKFNATNAIKEINRRIKGLKIVINRHHFQNFVNYYDIKSNKELCFVYKIHRNPVFSYSSKTIDLIVGEIKKDPEHILGRIKKANPRSKGILSGEPPTPIREPS